MTSSSRSSVRVGSGSAEWSNVRVITVAFTAPQTFSLEVMCSSQPEPESIALLWKHPSCLLPAEDRSVDLK